MCRRIDCETHYLELRFHARSLLSKRCIIPRTLTLSPDSGFKFHTDTVPESLQWNSICKRLVSIKHARGSVGNARNVDVECNVCTKHLSMLPSFKLFDGPCVSTASFNKGHKILQRLLLSLFFVSSVTHKGLDGHHPRCILKDTRMTYHPV